MADFSVNAHGATASILSLEGPGISDNERDLFRGVNPLGFILFARNIDTPDQLRGLCGDLKDVVGRDCPILIDQEGGRVQRLRAPHFTETPPMKKYGDIWGVDGRDAAVQALRDDLRILARQLISHGINVDCAPVLDVVGRKTHEIIGDRAFSDAPALVAELGAAAAQVLAEEGVTPIIKHIPGHGRALSDSHLELPVVDLGVNDLDKHDFDPFRIVSSSGAGRYYWAMTAHILYTALDKDLPASLSPDIIQNVIRGKVGFDGILICDDLDMKALDSYGDGPKKAALALDAGCDLALYCAGEFKNMVQIAESVPKLREDSLQRLQNSAIC